VTGLLPQFAIRWGEQRDKVCAILGLPCARIADRIDSGQSLFRDRKRCGFLNFSRQVYRQRGCARNMCPTAYLTRFCAAVVRQTFSSDALIHGLPSVQHCSNKCGCRSELGADVSLRKLKNDVNYLPCALSESNMMPSEASNVAV